MTLDPKVRSVHISYDETRQLYYVSRHDDEGEYDGMYFGLEEVGGVMFCRFIEAWYKG